MTGSAWAGCPPELFPGLLSFIFRIWTLRKLNWSGERIDFGLYARYNILLCHLRDLLFFLTVKRGVCEGGGLRIRSDVCGRKRRAGDQTVVIGVTAAANERTTMRASGISATIGQPVASTTANGYILARG